MCLSPVSIWVDPNPYDCSLGYRSKRQVTVPCGKCVECLKNRQSSIAIRAYRESLKYGSCIFDTLTYSPSRVPFAQTLELVSKDSGESYIYKKAELVTHEGFLSKLRNMYLHVSELFVYKHFFADLGDSVFNVIYTPTLYYEDVKLCIKLFRTRYYREFGVKLDFKYLVCGEYGSKKSHRPHYHVLFFGLTLEQVKYFNRLWSDKGFSYVESVRARNVDGSDGFAKIASYVGKYCAKGQLSPYTVHYKYTLPFRLVTSRGLGLSDLVKLKNYILCTDVFGLYNQNAKSFIDFHGSKLYELVLSRCHYDFNGYSCPLPLGIIRKVFNYSQIEGKACFSYLYYKVMEFARSKSSSLYEAQLSELARNHPDWPREKVIVEYDNELAAARERRAEVKTRAFMRGYSKSKI